MMLQSPVYLTQNEHNILDIAAFIKFGELESVDLDTEDREIHRELSPGQERFIKLVRDEEYAHIDRIVVHEGVPATIEIYGDRHGIKYKIKRKV